MFIQAVDGKLYENPLIYGEGFFIRADGIEDPEIVIKYSPTTTLESSRRLAYHKLRELDMTVKLDEDGDEDIYAFPPQWEGLVKASKFTMKFKAQIPVPHDYKSKIDYPVPSCKFLAWELEFPMQEVLDFLDRNKFNAILVSFLLGHEVRPPIDGHTLKKLKKNLEQQLTGLKAARSIRLKRIEK